MLKIIESKNSWIDITEPKSSDIKKLESEFRFHPVVLEELIPPSSRSKVELYDNYLFIVYHLPIYDPKIRYSKPAEIDFLITKNTLITVRYGKIEPLELLFKEIDKNSKSGKKIIDEENSGFLLYQIFQKNLEFSLRQLTHIAEKVKNIEDSIFQGKEKMMIREISFVKRDILDQRLIARPQKTILESLSQKGIKFFGKEMEIYFNDLLGDYEKIWDALENLKETIESLESTNNTLFESRMSEIMKFLTVMSFIIMPLSLLSNILSMDLSWTPLGNHPLGFIIALGIMLFIAVILFITFKIKKWL